MNGFCDPEGKAALIILPSISSLCTHFRELTKTVTQLQNVPFEIVPLTIVCSSQPTDQFHNLMETTCSSSLLQSYFKSQNTLQQCYKRNKSKITKTYTQLDTSKSQQSKRKNTNTKGEKKMLRKYF